MNVVNPANGGKPNWGKLSNSKSLRYGLRKLP